MSVVEMPTRRVRATLPRARIALIALVALAALVFTGWYAIAGHERSTVEGIVIRVDTSSLTDVRGFDLRTADGTVLSFEVGQLDLAPPAFNAQHLVVHQATAEPVAVTFEEQNGKRVAVRLVDGD